jgi:hypothetical protein
MEELNVSTEELFDLGWYTSPEAGATEPEEYFEGVSDERNKMTAAGAVPIENLQGVYKNKPALILGSGPSYSHANVGAFNGHVFSCNAAAFEVSGTTYAVVGDPSAAVPIMADENLSMPIICRTNDEHTDKFCAIMKKRPDQKVILVTSPIDCSSMAMHDGNSMLYVVRMTGTLAYISAAYMGCNPIFLAGIDYLPYSVDSMSRYDITPWYKVPPAFDSNLVHYRGRSISGHWKTEIEITEAASVAHYKANGAVTYRVADQGLLSGIPVVPEHVKKEFWNE